MSVITISRGEFSGGKMLAESLAVKLGYRSIDRDYIVGKAAASGVSPEELRDALEIPPAFLDRFEHRKYIYLALIQAALAEEVQDGKVVYHGHGGQLLLKGAPVFRVRIIAPMALRVRRCQEQLPLGGDEALAYIHRSDQERRKWTQYLYGVDWGDPTLYDMVLNLENIDVEDATEAVAAVACRQHCFAFGPGCRAAMRDLVIASRVKANLALNSATADMEVEIVSEDGRVRISGKASNPTQLTHADEVARAVAGVTGVNLDALQAMSFV